MEPAPSPSSTSQRGPALVPLRQAAPARPQSEVNLRGWIYVQLIVVAGQVVLALVLGPGLSAAALVALMLPGAVVGAGLLVAFRQFATDRADRGRAEELDRERQERSRHLEALGTLAAGAAHELGTPLSTIAIVAKELTRSLERSGASEDALADAQLIHDEVARCRRILNRMSTDSGGGIGETLSPTCPTELAALVVGEMGARDRVSIDATDLGKGGLAGVAAFELPREGLATAIRAIVQNAIDASPSDRSVGLAIRREEASLLVLVTDEGCGMSAEAVERALEPFFTTKEVGRGMGLGLYLASHFIENLGGALEITSTLGAGTSVKIEIPMAAGAGVPPVCE